MIISKFFLAVLNNNKLSTEICDIRRFPIVPSISALESAITSINHCKFVDVTSFATIGFCNCREKFLFIEKCLSSEDS